MPNTVPDYHVESLWSPSDSLEGNFYTITLTNHSDTVLSQFRLGVSGPACVFDGCEIENASFVKLLSTYAEIAPPKGLELAPGESWSVTLTKFNFPFRHWTDGVVTAMVIRDGQAVLARTTPTRNSIVSVPNRSGVTRFGVPVPAPAPYSIVPWPNDMRATGYRTAPDGFAVSTTDMAGSDALNVFEDLTAKLFPGEGLVRGQHAGGYPVMCRTAAGYAHEAYELRFGPDSVEIRATTRTGHLYGLITLGQIARGARHHRQSYGFPTGGVIVDSPAMDWRGCHFDVSRRFYAPDEVAQFVRTMAWSKLNRFHWHLSEDEGWRIEIDAFPELTARAAWRGHGLEIPPLLGSGPEPHGGYYTKDEVRSLVALADGLGIETIPEIDVPGHSYALIEALPQLKDPGENGIYKSIQWFPNNSLNPAVEASYDVIETIFSEMIDLFPSQYFHIGADEVPHDAWHSSPKAQALLAEIGGDGAAELQAHFLRRVQKCLTEHGKITGAWEEAAFGGGIDKANSYLVGWRAVAAARDLAREGYRVVVAPGQAYYLDMANGPDWQEPGAGWAGWSSPEKTYRFDPLEGWNETDTDKLLGVQGCIWCEPMTERAVFDRLVYPRLSAIAETGWTRADLKDWDRFASATSLLPSLFGSCESS
ncbi:beta-N-acetylhexosaminidase [Devosia pacifica]|uniref:beta-N-acetylhexosaminidase n=1 Tax=Devosia pacifica TaxID=1335967 RepID=A0A918S3Q4_9HYPH|nr:beta-N-acetylhexosaminidase [Devosia pacifica]GHA22290.1 beta-N-acetylhexosaminidase [Devosia pacifica]